ncbi:MAG: hypothetical protein GWN58_36530, partial [Anaerolineae bacterium]|nr:hypothetical protein [Anaerolineae bacterium]
LEEDSVFDGLTGVGLAERLCEHIDPENPPKVVVVSGIAGAELVTLLNHAMLDLPF